MASTYSSTQAFLLMTPGDPAVANAWGANLNSGDFQLIDAAIGGVASINASGGSNITLTANSGSADQARNKHFVVTGTLTGNVVLLWPPAPRSSEFSLFNNTGGAFTLSAGVSNGGGAAAGTTVQITQGGTALLVSDGTNITRAVDLAGLGSSAGTVTEVDTGTGLTGGPITNSGSIALASIASGNMLANTSGSSAAPIATAIPTLKVQRITGSGTFTVPAGVSSATVFKFTLIGGGGAGGGATVNQHGGSGGGSGGVGECWYSGFAPADSVTVTIGAGGTGVSGDDGNAGGSTTIAKGAVTIGTATGGSGGDVNSYPNGSGSHGVAGTFTASAGASGLTLVTSQSLAAKNGDMSYSPSLGSNAQGGLGGSNPYGPGGGPSPTGGAAGGSRGGGGQGNFSSGSNVTGASGGTGFVIVEWVQ